MSLTGDDAEHVVVVPGGSLASGAYTGRTGSVAADQVERALAHQSQIACRCAMAHPAVIFPEGDVEHPVHGILDRPMSADRRRQDGRIVATARQEIADLTLDFVGAMNAADALDG